MSGKSIKAGKASVSLEIQDRLQKGLNSAEKRLKSFAGGLTRIGGGIAAVGATLGSAFIAPIMAASDFQERMGKFDTVFGKNAKSVKEWGDNFAEEVGRSKSDVVDFLAGTQDLLIPLGFEEGAATELSKSLTGLAVDMASFNNASDADVMRDLQSALTGSGEVMKKYGVVLDEAGLKQELLNQGLDPKLATNAQKAQARYNIILRGTTAAQGDALRTSGSFANRMKALKASFSDFMVAAGTPLLDVLSDIALYLQNGLKWVSDFVQANTHLVPIIAGVAAGIFAFGVALVAGGVIASSFAAIIGVVSTVIGVLAAVFGAILSPIGLLAAAIVGLIVYFFAFTEAGQATMAAVTEIFGKIVEIGKQAFSGIKDAIETGNFGLAAKIAFTGIQLAIVEVMKSVLEFFGGSIDSMIKMIGQVIREVASLVGKINGARVSAVNWLSGIMGSIIGVDTTLEQGVATQGAQQFQQDANSFGNSAADDVTAFLTDALDADKLKAELDALTEEARLAAEAKRKENEADEAAKGTAPGSQPSALELLQKQLADAQANAANSVDAGMKKSDENLAGFSGAALNAQFGGGKDVQNKIKEAAEDTAQNTKELIRIAQTGGLLFS